MMIEADSYDPLLFFYLDSVFMFRELLSGRVLLLVKYQEKGMIRMPRKRRSTKSRIVKAAWNLFYKNGYEQTTVEDIINAAKTSKGTFYHNFCKPFEIDPFLVGKGFLVFGDQLRRIKVCKQMDIHAGLDHVE